MSREYSVTKSFKFAFEGIKAVFKKEPNLRIHFIFAIIALVTAFLLGFSTIEWLILAFTIFFVLILELLNTALEALVDLVSPEIKPEAKIAKDVSAAAVFLAAILSVVVGIVLFLPKILLVFRR
jgi:diacylglycerol kinase